jgi:hypothetical protein
MSDPIELGHNHLPWNKGRLLGQKRPLRRTFGSFAFAYSSKAAREISRCLISQSTANQERAILCGCKRPIFVLSS